MHAAARTALATGLALALAAAGPALAQQLYKQVGPDGKVTYSDRPATAGQKAEKISNSRVSSVGSGAAASGAKTPADQEQAFQQRRAEADEKAKKDAKLAQETKAREQQCATLRREIAGMQTGGRIARVNANGEREFLDDGQVQQEVARMQGEVAANCK
jgi:hypothetical protein